MIYVYIIHIANDICPIMVPLEDLVRIRDDILYIVYNYTWYVVYNYDIYDVWYMIVYDMIYAMLCYEGPFFFSKKNLDSQVGTVSDQTNLRCMIWYMLCYGSDEIS